MLHKFLIAFIIRAGAHEELWDQAGSTVALG